MASDATVSSTGQVFSNGTLLYTEAGTIRDTGEISTITLFEPYNFGGIPGNPPYR